jgi:hypothetical protein
MNIQLGKTYKAKGGWTVKIDCTHNGTNLGKATDSQGDQEPGIGMWDDKGKCIQRGDSKDPLNTEPYNLISEI